MSRTLKIETVNNRVNHIEKDISKIKSDLLVEQPRPQIRNRKYYYELKKAIIDPNFERKTVLTDSTWDYVLTYIQRENKEDAIFYWKQARNFYNASLNLDNVSAPLTIYYCFLNATKALLKYKNQRYGDKHGVSGKREKGRTVLQNEIIYIHNNGVLAGLSNYLEEKNSTTSEAYNLKDILYNIPYIHRAYILTYGSTELFVPILEPKFVYYNDRGWFEFKLEREYSNNNIINGLNGFSVDKHYCNEYEYVIKRNKDFIWECTRKNKPIQKSLDSFHNYHKKIRKQLEYIYSPNELWYVKKNKLKSTSIIDRNTLVLTFAAMHKLSELARYNPDILRKHLEKEQNWLLSEFINKSIVQFIDSISSEITGDDFRQTGFRT